jgi:hypothetical protein
VAADLIPVRPDNPFQLGRAARETDERNWDFRALIGPPVEPLAEPRKVPWWRPSNSIFDQDGVGQCTCEASIGMAITRPFRQQFTEIASYDTFEERNRMYHDCFRFDPAQWGPHEGRLVSSPLKLMLERGEITGYRWLRGEEELREWLMFYAPAKVGITWKTGMFFPDSQGRIFYTGDDAGGHDIEVNYYSRYRDAYRLPNSWGPGWGINGVCWLPRQHMDNALSEGGEAVTFAL